MLAFIFVVQATYFIGVSVTSSSDDVLIHHHAMADPQHARHQSSLASPGVPRGSSLSAGSSPVRRCCTRPTRQRWHRRMRCPGTPPVSQRRQPTPAASLSQPHSSGGTNAMFNWPHTHHHGTASIRPSHRFRIGGIGGTIGHRPAALPGEYPLLFAPLHR